MPDFIPQPLGEFAQWIRLQKTKRAATAAVLGLTPADVTRLDLEDDAMLLKMEQATAAQAASKSATETRDTTRDTYLTARRAEIARAKTHPAYTEALGKDNEWVAPETADRRDDLKPTLKVRRVADGARFDWSKLGQDYAQIFRRPAGTAEWGRYLAIDSRSPYVDTETGLKGAYEYKAQLYHDDAPVGQPSDIVVFVWG